jgi:hypothetical protein
MDLRLKWKSVNEKKRCVNGLRSKGKRFILKNEETCGSLDKMLLN